MTKLERMQKVLKENPAAGRWTLVREAQVSGWEAQKFLMDQRVAGTDVEPPTVEEVLQFASGLDPQELELVRRSLKCDHLEHRAEYQWAKDSFKFAAPSDTHWGHKKSELSYWDRTCSLADREKCDFMLHPGDISEGMSFRPGHVYELTAVGTSAQLDLAESRLRMAPCPVKGISGNHDLWAYKSSGVDFGLELSRRIPDIFEYLGQWEAVVRIGGVSIMLWHGEDGSSYATSYRTQKFVESLSGGEKPSILLSGHAHKSLFHMYRNVHVFECGTLCGQTRFMRGKKLSAHVGVWIVEVWPSPDGGIERISPVWVPFFTP